MKDVRRLHLESLSTRIRLEIQHLLPADLRHLLSKDAGIDLFIYAVHASKKIISVGIASWFSALKHCSINHLAGDPAHFPSLFHHLCETAKESGALVIDLHYPSDDLLLEKIAQENGLNHSRVCLKKYVFDGFQFNPPWIQHANSYPEGFQSFLWTHLKEEERTQLEHQQFEALFPESVSPLYHEELLEPMNSVGLRHGNQVIGWSICHRLTPDLIRYAAYFIFPEYRNRRFAMNPLLKSIDIQRHSPVQWAELIYNPQGVPLTWSSFVEKRLGPYCQKMIPIREAWWQAEENSEL